ncbi:MAG: hypothetical protein HY234_05555 [Acidobacteria bacterium]|nr:hypothetical protein [Acidobacteriota bacterium]
MTDSRKNNSRCEFLFADGRRCRMRPADPGLSLCVRHLQLRQQQEAAARIGEEIVAADDPLNTQESIHKALGNVFRFCARNLISPRSAAVLGYVGQLMLVSRPSIERTVKSLLPLLQLSLKTAHQNEKSSSDAGDRLHKHAILELEATNGLIDLFKTFQEMSAEESLKFMKFAASFVDKKEDKKNEEPPSAKS